MERGKNKFFWIIAILITLSVLFYFIFLLYGDSPEENFTCGDDSVYGECSKINPFYCDEGILIEKATLCGCGEGMILDGDLCKSKYQTGAKNIDLNYILKGVEGQIKFTVYSGVTDYISNLSKFNGNKNISYFKERNINDVEQRLALLPLVTKIQNIAKNKDDQARIAVSLVQQITYQESEKIISFFGVLNTEIRYSRYPYEIIYEGHGVCGEKSELLAFLLQELDYGYVLYYYPEEDHEAFGIKCPNQYSKEGDGYCFIETTGPSIITNDKNSYPNIGGPLESTPEIAYTHEGNVFGRDNFYEYNDARKWIELNEIVSETGGLNVFKKFGWDKLKDRYGL